MDFSEAFDLLLDGELITRERWNQATYYRLTINDSTRVEQVYPRSEGIKVYTVNQFWPCDVLAKDWCVYRGEVV